MNDLTAKRPLRVRIDSIAGPYIMLPVSQLADLRHLLDQRQIRYSVAEDAISLDGGPETTFVDLGRGTDVEVVQSLLDSLQ